MNKNASGQTQGRMLLGGKALKSDRGDEYVTAGLAQPGMTDVAPANKLGPLRYELFMAALRTERAGEITGEGDYCGRSIA